MVHVDKMKLPANLVVIESKVFKFWF